MELHERARGDRVALRPCGNVSSLLPHTQVQGVALVHSSFVSGREAIDDPLARQSVGTGR